MKSADDRGGKTRRTQATEPEHALNSVHSVACMIKWIEIAEG